MDASVLLVAVLVVVVVVTAKERLVVVVSRDAPTAKTVDAFRFLRVGLIFIIILPVVRFILVPILLFVKSLLVLPVVLPLGSPPMELDMDVLVLPVVVVVDVVTVVVSDRNVDASSCTGVVALLLLLDTCCCCVTDDVMVHGLSAVENHTVWRVVMHLACCDVLVWCAGANNTVYGKRDIFHSR